MNCAEAVAHGLTFACEKRRRPERSKLTEEEWEQLRQRFRAGEPASLLAQQSGLSREPIYGRFRGTEDMIARRERRTQDAIARRARRRRERRGKAPAERRYAYHELLTREEWELADWGEDQPSSFELAERLGIGHNYVHRALQFHGIPTRGRAEQIRVSYKRRRDARLAAAKAERLRLIAEIRRLLEQADADGRELQRADAEVALLTQEREELRAANRQLVELLTLARNQVRGVPLLEVAGLCQDCGAGL